MRFVIKKPLKIPFLHVLYQGSLQKVFVHQGYTKFLHP